MKHLRPIGCLLALCVLLAIAACKKDDDPTDPDGTDLPETGVQFTCKDSLGIEGVFVGIAPQASDRDNGVFLRSGTTDFAGKIKFTNIDPQLMYYSASRTTSGGVVERTGSVEIVADMVKRVTVQF